MKSLKIWAALFVFAAFISTSIVATAADSKEVKIKVSVTCDGCKDKITKALKSEGGVIESNINVKDKTATIKYDAEKTSPEKIRQAIANLGYDADDVKAKDAHKCTDGKDSNCLNDKAKHSQKDAKCTGDKKCSNDKKCTGDKKAGCCPSKAPEKSTDTK